MRKEHLIATALAAALAAAPGIALAQNTDTGAQNSAGTNYGANGTGSKDTGNTAAANNNASNAKNPAAYQQVGRGNYDGMASPISGQKGQANASNNDQNQLPHQRNSLLADNGDARASKVIGTNVYNSQDQKLGSVDDVLIGSNGVWAIISTNDHNVAVPFQKLQFGNANVNSDDKLVLPDTDQKQLNSNPVFRYDASDYASNNPAAGTNNGGPSLFGNSNAPNGGTATKPNNKNG